MLKEMILYNDYGILTHCAGLNLELMVVVEVLVWWEQRFHLALELIQVAIYSFLVYKVAVLYFLSKLALEFSKMDYYF